MILAISLIPTLPVAITLLMVAVVGLLIWLNVQQSKANISLHFDTETEELETNRLKFQSIFDNSLIAMAFYSPQGLLIDINKKMAEVVEYEKIGSRLFQSRFLDLPSIKDDFNPNGEVFHTCQKMFYPRIGLNKIIELKIRSVRDDNGKLLFYAHSVIDYSQDRNTYLLQRQHEAELQKTSKEIKKYEEELHYLLANSRMFIWSIDLDTRTINVSTKLNTAEVVLSFDEYLNLIAKDEMPIAKQFLDNYEKFAHDLLLTRHFPHTPINEDPGWYSISGAPIFDKNNRFKGHFGVIRDITRYIKVQEDLKRETERAQISTQKKSTFLANMTHEIRTPLNAIVGFSDLLQAIDDPAERHEFIRIILNNCDMLLRLINDILEASTIEQSNMAITPELIDFAQAFNDISETLAQRVEEPNVEFISESPYPTFRTIIDKGRMQQVITNFVTNAVKYTHQGHIKIGYRYQADPQTNSAKGIYMYCEDTGAGIPKDKQASVFERFVKLNDFVQGTGLGLSICESIAKQCNGQIGLHSEGEGYGSTFWIWIPCQRLDGKEETT